MTPDVLVVGAGIVGAACARALAASGARVTVVDRAAPASGTSAKGEGNLLVSDKGPGPELELARFAAGLWPAAVAELADELGDGFPSLEYERKGGLVVSTTDAGAAPLLDFAATQRAAGVDARAIDPAGARELEPWLTPGVTAAVHYPEDAQVQPVIAAEALLASARRHGAEVRAGVDAAGALLGADGRLAGIRTAAGERLEAGAVVLAAGPWSGAVSAAFGAPVPVRPRRGMVLVTSRMPHRVFRKVYDGDYFDATQSGDAALQTSAVVESTAAGTVLLGSSRQQIGFDDRMRPAVLAAIAARAIRLFPFLAEAQIMRAYGGFRPFVPDHLPIIGEDPRLPGLWHASGHEGAGIGLSLATAEIVAAGILGLPEPLEAAAFRPGRAGLLAADARSDAEADAARAAASGGAGAATSGGAGAATSGGAGAATSGGAGAAAAAPGRTEAP
ncbi:NAD(P)/FAD-dependent oxidoreductase [Agromyces archimandritae]|uniref:NAD(P)/FAD-dependent oxidoreductase n=1 Tax=Agromyces archimandritae TaxID=2781962 RepID=UPI001FCFB6B9|nr:FAD-dependent oxidoreductase [Agromyces archimandritae]